MFDDKATEINQLTNSINQDIKTINAELEELEVKTIVSFKEIGVRSNAAIRVFSESRVRSGRCGSAQRGANGNDEGFQASAGSRCCFPLSWLDTPPESGGSG